MLSRVAESLYWMARYIERAEDLTRLIAVNFNARLDLADTGARPAGWTPLVAVNGDEALFFEIYPQATPEAVIEFMLWHPLNPNAVIACVTRARENARGVREQISSEMWEHLNRLYMSLRAMDRASVLRSPVGFFQQVRDGSQGFQGVSLATLTHSEPFEFLRLGTHLERADKTVRILAAKYAEVSRLSPDSAETALHLIAMLRSCSAYEPFRRSPGLALEADQVAQFLLLSRAFPRAALFCANQCLLALAAVGDPADQNQADHPRRSLGRLSAELEYLDGSSVMGDQLETFLEQLLGRFNHIGDGISRAYFNTRAVLPDERPRQQQQQQQQ
jgi:uncharacterized alpha-E superfamily protein